MFNVVFVFSIIPYVRVYYSTFLILLFIGHMFVGSLVRDYAIPDLHTANSRSCKYSFFLITRFQPFSFRTGLQRFPKRCRAFIESLDVSVPNFDAAGN